MASTTCAVCGQPLDGKRVAFRLYIEQADLSYEQYKIGLQCQHCGASYCQEGKKDHPKKHWWSGWEKIRCPRCRELIGPGHFIVSRDAPELEAPPEPVGATEPPLDRRVASQIDKLLDEGKWARDPALRDRLLKLLQSHGQAYLDRCLEQLTSGTILTAGGVSKRVKRVGSAAELGAAWLFEDGAAEGTLLHMVVQDLNVRGDPVLAEVPEATLTYLIGALLSIEALTKSGMCIPAISHILLTDEKIYFRTVAARQLGRVDWDGRVVDALIEALGEKQRPNRFSGSLWTRMTKAPSVQECALVSLLQIGDERGLAAAIPVLGRNVTFAQETEIEFSGEQSVALLAEIGAKAPHLLIDALQADNMPALAAGQVTSGLGLSRNPDAVEPLIRALRDERSMVRSHAAVALGTLGDMRAFDPLLALVADGVVGDSAVAALKLLIAGREDDPQVQARLVSALEDPQAAVRAFAAVAIGTLGLVAANDALERATFDEDRKVRNAAKSAIKTLNGGR